MTNENVNVRVTVTGRKDLKKATGDFKDLTQAARRFVYTINEADTDTIIKPKTFNAFPATLAKANTIATTVGAVLDILRPIIAFLDARFPALELPTTATAIRPSVPTTPGEPAEPADEKKERELLANALRIRDQNIDKEYDTRSTRETELIGTSLDGRLAALETENEARSEGIRQAGGLFAGALVNAIRGRDVTAAFSNLFYNRIQDIFSNMITQALSTVPGPGRFFSALFSWLPFGEGGIFDPKVSKAARGRIYRPRPGGYNVILGEGGKREAVIPDSPKGERLLLDHVLSWFPNILKSLNPPAAPTFNAILGAAIAERTAAFPRHYPILHGTGTGYVRGQINVEAPVVPAPEVTVVVDGLDPHGLRAYEQIKKGSYAHARIRG
jgi:hypothetical protein